jgi:IS66 Orf2 like protein
MIFEHIREVFVAQHRVDFRMGVFGLRAEMNKMELDPYVGDCCVFIHPNHRQVRVVGATPSGCFLVIKFFESGALQEKLRFLKDPSFVEISKMELALLIEGASFSNVKKVPDWATCKNQNKKVTALTSNV